ncbi:MAG TPA: SLBB domain-containing protein [Vicinamibacterales bacterium]|jgi:polysaccharide export outer membrane protein|nr:SLBB domain-containing protein [Vicinamibacterales bacterium]
MTTWLLAVMLAAPALQTAPPLPPAPVAASYKVGPQDKLNINVLGISEFSAQNVLVDGDGKFDYLNFGRIDAKDKTLREIAAAVRTLLIERKQHNDPTVTVDVAEYRSQMVYISGAVRETRSYRITGAETLVSVLASAGFLPSSGSYVEVIRNKPVPGTKYRFERKALEMGTAEPFPLQDGDSIVVPEAEKAFVRGEVKAPGAYEVTSGMTVLQLIASAGDFTDRASKSSVKIVRTEAGGKPHEIKVPKDLSTRVQPGDTVVVGKRIF